MSTTLQKTLYLIGFMGSGKSTVSRHMSRALDVPKIEMDDLLAAQKCDMIAFTGDLVDSRQTDWNQAKVLSDVLKKAAPVYFVTGNHEERLLAKESDAQEKLNDMGMIMLTNKVEYIKFL